MVSEAFHDASGSFRGVSEGLRFEGVPNVFQGFQKRSRGILGLYLGCFRGLYGVQEHSRGDPGRLRWLQRRSMDFQGVLGAFQRCSRDV